MCKVMTKGKRDEAFFNGEASLHGEAKLKVEPQRHFKAAASLCSLMHDFERDHIRLEVTRRTETCCRPTMGHVG